MINYYAYVGEKSLEESKKSQVNSVRLKAGSLDFAIKTCEKKFGKNKFKLYRFKNFNDNNSFEMILWG